MSEQNVAMCLLRLITEFSLVQSRMAHSVVHGGSIKNHVLLLKHATALMDRIERYDPVSKVELQTKISFFLAQAKHAPSKNRAQRDLSIAFDLLNRFDGCLGRAAPCQDHSTLPHEVLNRLIDRHAPQAELARYVTGMARRASLIEPSYRHICTSAGNAAFHEMPQQRFKGLHMRDLIGAYRFDTRSLQHMNSSLAGNKQGYYYALDVPLLGSRVMQCHMRSWRHASGETGGLALWVNDVTDRLTPAHGFADISHPGPDHSMDGTT